MFLLKVHVKGEFLKNKFLDSEISNFLIKIIFIIAMEYRHKSGALKRKEKAEREKLDKQGQRTFESLGFFKNVNDEGGNKVLHEKVTDELLPEDELMNLIDKNDSIPSTPNQSTPNIVQVKSPNETNIEIDAVTNSVPIPSILCPNRADIVEDKILNETNELNHFF